MAKAVTLPKNVAKAVEGLRRVAAGEKRDNRGLRVWARMVACWLEAQAGGMMDLPRGYRIASYVWGTKRVFYLHRFPDRGLRGCIDGGWKEKREAYFPAPSFEVLREFAKDVVKGFLQEALDHIERRKEGALAG